MVVLVVLLLLLPFLKEEDGTQYILGLALLLLLLLCLLTLERCRSMALLDLRNTRISHLTEGSTLKGGGSVELSSK